MDFNSNDEYLKAFPPNFGPKLERFNKLDRLSDSQADGLLPKNPQENIEATPVEMLELVCLDEDIECVELQEPIQVDLNSVDNKGDELLEDHKVLTLCEEDLPPPRERSCLAQPKIDESMSEMAGMALEMEVQRDNEMVLGEGNGEANVETMFSLQAIEATFFDAEAFGDIQVDGLPSTTQTIQKQEKDCEICIEYVIPNDTIKDPTFALNNINHYKINKSILVEEVTKATTMKDEIFQPPTLKDFPEGTQVFTEYERSITNIDTVLGNAMDVEAPLQGQYQQPTIEIEVVENTNITVDTPCEIEFVEKTLKTSTETSKNSGVVGQIEIKEPITLEIIEKTNIRAIPETQTSKNDVSEHNQIKDEVFGIEDPAMTLEVTEKTSIKAKAICQNEEETLFAMNVENASTSITRLDEDLGTCSDANFDKIVDSIMNDIAGIEADMEAENEEGDFEASVESNTQHQKTPIYKKSIGIEIDATCQDHVQSS